jgi:hypothetical protein
MSIDYGHARRWVGSVVLMRRGQIVELDRISEASDVGLFLVFERAGSMVVDAIDELRAYASDADQRFRPKPITRSG